MKKFLTMIMLLSSLTALSVSGPWKGVLQVGPQKLNVVFHFEEEVLFDSPDQGATSIPVHTDLLTPDSVALTIPLIKADYCGAIKGDSIVGAFKQGPYTFPLVLRPGKIKLSRPQTPEGPFPYKSQEVSFSNPQICGTLTIPTGYDFESLATSEHGNELTALVLVSGSGQQNRDEELFGHKPFAVIADYLARRGFATLRYDDRGVGCSKGNPAEVTIDSNAADALEAVKYLRQFPRFRKIGILGHSEGGLIGYMLAEKPVDFVVSIAGPTFNVVELLTQQNRNILQNVGVPGKIVDDYCKLYGKICEAGVLVDADSLAKSIGTQLPDELMANLRLLAKFDNPWLTSFLKTNPQQYLQKVAEAPIPMLLLGGDKDMQVPAGRNKQAFDAAGIKGSKSIIYNGLNHLLQPCTTGMPDEYGKIEETIQTEVLEDIVDWLQDNVERRTIK